MKKFESFYDTTLKALADSGHSSEDITFIGSRNTGHSCTWDEFKELCKQQEKEMSAYYNVPVDLVIVFRDGQYMDRHDSEHGYGFDWRYMKPFVIPKETKQITKFFTNGHDDFEDVHER